MGFHRLFSKEKHMMFRAPRQVPFGITLAILVVSMFATSAFGQQVYGSIYGTVTDATGAAVPNAKVTITDESKGTKYEISTNDAGNYTKGQLIPGTYQVQVEAQGFRKAVSKDVTVNVDQAARVDLGLSIGDVTQEVEVTASAPLLQSDRADVATTFTSKQLTDLPNINRQFQSYELLTPGTSRLNWQHASSENPQGSIQIQVNGQHFSGTGFQLDGTENQSPILGIIVINPNLDSITEAKIASQNYDAEFGYAGAGIGITSTKSGTNQIHGSAFEYLRNNSPGFQDYARNPFNSAENSQVPPVKRNQFGGSIGGPIKKDKLFFFGDAQILRQRFGSSALTSVPTANARNGNFNEYLGPITTAGLTDATCAASPSTAGCVRTTAGNSVAIRQDMIFDPSTGDPRTGAGRQAFQTNGILNALPANRITSQSLAILKFLPLPNAPGDSGAPFRRNYAGTGTQSFNSEQWDTRVDYFINEKSSFFGRYTSAAFNQTAPGVFGLLSGGAALDNVNFAGISDVLDQSVALGYTRTFSPTLITDFRFGYLRVAQNVIPPDIGTSPAKDAGIPGLNLDNFFTSGLPGFFFEGDAGTSIGYKLGGVNGDGHCNCPLKEQEQQYQFVANVNKISGNHSFKFGADIRYALNLRVPSDSHRAGELRFSPDYTGFVPTGSSSPQQGLGYATFLLGQVTGGGRYVSTSTDARERQKRWFFYGQDQWRLTPKLQINYGLRWELVFPETVNKAGNGAQLDISTGEIAVFGVGKTSIHGIQDLEKANFAPRLGITYQLTPKTVIRAGYGWAYELGTFGSTFGHNVTQNVPVLANQTFNRPNNFSGVFTLAQGPPAPTFLQPDSTTGRFRLPDGINGKARLSTTALPRVMAYNITVQHQLFRDLSVQIGYVGNQGRHQFFGDGPNYNINQAGFVPGVDQNLRKPFFTKYGWTQGIDCYCPMGNSRYDSFQVQVEKRYSAGYVVSANYTYQVAQADGGDSYTILYNRPLGYGEKDFIPHSQVVLAQNYEVPFGKGRKYGANINRVADAFLGGWNLNGVTTYYSGRPFTPNIGNFPAGALRPDVGPGGRPDKGTGSPYSSSPGRNGWLNVGPNGTLSSAFAVPANNTFGNYGVNTLRGPSFWNQDLGISKKFTVREGMSLEFRGESFNTFNHTNLGDPDNNVTGSNAGKITGLAPNYEMRRLQFALRLAF
jgi:hypothetical protein